MATSDPLQRSCDRFKVRERHARAASQPDVSTGRWLIFGPGGRVRLHKVQTGLDNEGVIGNRFQLRTLKVALAVMIGLTAVGTLSKNEGADGGQDNIAAYLKLEIAAAAGNSAAGRDQKNLTTLMSPTELKAALGLSRDWRRWHTT